MARKPPSADCPICGAWIPCQHPILVTDKKELTGPQERWVALESKDEALERHLKDDCGGT